MLTKDEITELLDLLECGSVLEGRDTVVIETKLSHAEWTAMIAALRREQGAP